MAENLNLGVDSISEDDEEQYKKAPITEEDDSPIIKSKRK